MIEYTRALTSQEYYERHGYYVLREFIPPAFIYFLKEYFDTLKKNNSLLKGDSQAPNSFCTYGDPCYDTFLLLSTNLISNAIGKKLAPTYTYGRIYLNGSDLKPHRDREECQHSVTLFLGGEYEESWPIFIENLEDPSQPHGCYLEPGDAVIYKGHEMVHWREVFKGTSHYQLFMHYVDYDGPFKNTIFDSRPYIGADVKSKNYGFSNYK